MKTTPLIIAGKPVLEYVTDVTGSGLPTPHAGFIHPLYTPGGKVITDLAPPDHPHHRGVFLAWYAMHGAVDADFWGWGAHAPVEGRRIVNRSAVLADGLKVQNDWLAGDRIVLQENTTVTCAEPGVVDIHYRLTPAFDLRLAQSAFAGFCVRLPREKPVRFFDPKGEVSLPDPHFQQPSTCWPAAEWYRAEVAGVGSVTVIPDAGNPPALWFNNRDLRMCNPCITAPGDVRLAAGTPFHLRYRLVVQSAG
jgi:hypothetical protein